MSRSKATAVPMMVDVLPGMNAGASTSAVPSPIEGSGTAGVLLGSWALSPTRPTPIPPRHECRGFSALLVIPNYGERYHNGEAIATGFVESTVNEVVSKRFCKKQQMRWSKEGAHWLLQTRVRTLNGELAGIFKRWYPDLDMKAKEIPMAA